MSETNTDKTTYYYSNGQRIPLVRDPGAYAVRFRGGAKSDSNALSTEAQFLLRTKSEHLGFVPNQNLQIFRLVAPPTGEGPPALPEGVDAARARLKAERVIEFTAPVYRRGNRGDIMLTTREFAAQFKPEITRDKIMEFNSRYGVQILRTLDYAENAFVLEAPDTDGPLGPVALGNLYYESELTEFSHADLIIRQHWRSAPSTATVTKAEVATRFDAERNERNVYQNQQWHLAKANVIDAWSITRGDPGINICILDDGIDVGHAELSGKVVAQFDFLDNTSDVQPKRAGDNHGTACAGVATARGVKALGVAPNCSLIGGRTPNWNFSSEYGRMFKWAADQGADVISCSWGPEDETGLVDPLPDVIRVAIRYCVTQGRRGKGCAVLFAAGNGYESVSLDGYASNPDVMAIAACTDADEHAAYSDFGPEISICAPSNGGAKSILTTDRRGSSGYNNVHPGIDDPDAWPDPFTDPFPDLDYTSEFGGTSSSTPLVAGVIGLMLSVNPNLTPQQIRNCLQNTATKIGPAGSYDARGHSHYFGFGKVNAGAAVREARRLLGNVTPTNMPTIVALQQSVSRSGPPPSFTIDPRPNTHYAVEFAARPELLDTRPAGSSEYYASWNDSTQLMSSPAYTLPQGAWDRIKNNDKLYFRVWTSSSQSDWVNTLASTGTAGAAAAAFIQVAGQTPVSTGRPVMTGPASASRSGPPPSFTIDPRPNTHYAVEFAARRELLDAASGQPANEYYASWGELFMSSGTYQLRPDIWDRLKGNTRLFYRVWTSASSQTWTNTLLSADTGATAPSVEITGAGTGVNRTVTFPSGLTLNVADSELTGGIDYSDSRSSGVPLLSVAGRGEERLSSSFLVKELARDATFARIDVALVNALQKLRNALNAQIIVVSGYRHPAQDLQAGGLPNNGHVSGQTAEIRVAGRTPRDLVRFTLQTLGCGIGVGLGANSIEIDVGSPGTWVLPGSAMSAEQFEDFVSEICPGNRSRNRIDRVVRHSTPQKPEITGPETANAAGPAPEFRVVPGRNSYYAVEVAVDPSDFAGSGPRENLLATRFYGSYMEGLKTVEGLSSIYILPQEVWNRLARAALDHRGRLYYRVITTAAPERTWPGVESSLPDDDWRQAPGIDVWLRPDRIFSATDGRNDDVLWRKSRP